MKNAREACWLFIGRWQTMRIMRRQRINTRACSWWSPTPQSSISSGACSRCNHTLPVPISLQHTAPPGRKLQRCTCTQHGSLLMAVSRVWVVGRVVYLHVWSPRLYLLRYAGVWVSHQGHHEVIEARSKLGDMVCSLQACSRGLRHSREP